ncbi:MAG: 2Fe-2S iron-sulfur cluster-binding protein, partial [Gammaproteobacteria bacterium]
MKISQPNRLERGGRIDRSRPLGFRFNGRSLQGFAGDTLASALLASGVVTVGRSFKLHRPRGIVGSGAEEPNAIMQIGAGASTVPNSRATQVQLYEGLRARSTKGWPSVNHDIAAINDVFGRLLGAGFYYKTFMYPKGFWEHYESLIRRTAGLGSSPRVADPDHYEHRNAHCDVLVAGAGPAGLMAALAAARSGARVLIADEQNEFGGTLLSTREEINRQPAAEWLAEVLDQLAAFDDVIMLPRSTVFGYFDHNFLGIAERCTEHLGERCHERVRQRLWRVRARQAVLAQGAFERPLVFCNNDRPGVMLASAVSCYVNRYAVCPGKRAVVFTNNDSAYRTAFDLQGAGASVAIVDSRAAGAGELGHDAREAGITVLPGHVVTDVRGRGRIREVRIAQWNGDASSTIKDTISSNCDLLAVSGGWNPAVHLHSQAGGRIIWDETGHCFV